MNVKMDKPFWHDPRMQRLRAGTMALPVRLQWSTDVLGFTLKFDEKPD